MFFILQLIQFFKLLNQPTYLEQPTVLPVSYLLMSLKQLSTESQRCYFS